ncbi:MAG: ring-cleaving dioxygenase [Paracoccus sp. (in: a-proteobacteria)]|uniref:ring-cleaving dioxygenase n=1 Tax=Paracoccus sp. TaxID=267 RepID=UPI0039E29C69
MQLTGLHHLTAITAQARENKQFYTGTMGLRLVKKSVNQDDTRAYHLFYADALATPGTDLSFFGWPAARERRGTNSISCAGLRIGPNSFDYWAARLSGLGLDVGNVDELDGRVSLAFEDAEGMRFRMVEDSDEAPAHPWEHSPVPAEHQIHGLGPVTLSVPHLGPTEQMLTEVMNMRKVRDYRSPDHNQVHVYEMGEGGPGAEVHVTVQPGLSVVRQGAGGIHHVAFRVPDRPAIQSWMRRLTQMRVRNSGEVDRHYFRSLYFREPGGCLFEIATDDPGFAVDEDVDKLGRILSLPPALEGARAEIEARLKPLD